MTYKIVDFLKAGTIVIHPSIQRRAQYPFDMAAAKRFFSHFVEESFAFGTVIKSITIFDGKEVFPRHSYAVGFMYSQTIEELDGLEQRHDKIPQPVGKLHLECGGTHERVLVRVETMA